MIEQALKELIANPLLQTALVGGIVWLVLRALKALKWLPADGADLAKRITAAVTALVVEGAGAWLAWITQHTPANLAHLVAVVVLAFMGATALHALTKPKPA